jgi:hypothetical protein
VRVSSCSGRIGFGEEEDDELCFLQRVQAMADRAFWALPEVGMGEAEEEGDSEVEGFEGKGESCEESW